ncbi:hypothetical protein [Actinoplanes subtropicus]|uniref:hypothetical protein n=1 Tax=Actinoplanes subtropicus TaxID=543632 RepID=UPI0009FD786B|nr:hypothetical protein [Actinoplanes subtropicus]
MRAELLSLSRDVADKVARHLVAAGQIIDEDAELALEHAKAARRLASRIAVVREAVGLAAYAAGDWSTAIADLRAYHRMTGSQTHLAEIADSERAQGHPERAIDLYRGADIEKLDKSSAIELLIVAAGARGDLGQHDAAVAMLQVRELTTDDDADWAARLRYAYADALLAADRREEAREWFSRAAAVDEEQLTDATERLLELDGITIEGDEDEDEDEDDDDRAVDLDDDAEDAENRADDGEDAENRAEDGEDFDEDDEDEDFDDEAEARAEDDEDFDDDEDDFEDDGLEDEDDDELSARGDGLPEDDDLDDDDEELDEVDAKAKTEAEDDIVDDEGSGFEADVDTESDKQAGADGQGDEPAAGPTEPAAGPAETAAGPTEKKA